MVVVVCDYFQCFVLYSLWSVEVSLNEVEGPGWAFQSIMASILFVHCD